MATRRKFETYTPHVSIGEHICIVCGGKIAKGEVYLGKGGAARIHLGCSGLSEEEQESRAAEARSRQGRFGRREATYTEPLRQVSVPMPPSLIEAGSSSGAAEDSAAPSPSVSVEL